MTGADKGIYATNDGNGDLTISVNDVTGSGGDGIFATNDDDGGLSITSTSTGIVTGADDGIEATNNGYGDLTISVNDVTGSGGDGIYASNDHYNSRDLTISANDVTGSGGDGIYATNYGYGDLTINANDVTGSGGDGIYASNTYDGVNLSITATGTVTGDGNGIYTRSAGRGDLTINVNDVTGNNADGIYAYNTDSGINLSIATMGIVLGDDNGISAYSAGSGDLTINVNDVTGNNADGIYAANTDSGGDLFITATGTISGADDGIFASNSGRDLSITSTGIVTGADDGISVANYGSGGLTISANDVTGSGGDGIFADNSADGVNLSITVTGTVTGADDGIDARNSGSGDTVITVAEEARISGEVLAIRTNGGGIASNDTLNIKGSVYGDIELGGGDDTVNFAGLMTGDIFLGSGNDHINITGGRLDGRIVGVGEGVGEGVATVDIGSANSFTSNGVIGVKDYVIRSGTVYQQGDFNTVNSIIESGATLSFGRTVSGAGALESNGNLEFVVNDRSGGLLFQDGAVTLNTDSAITLTTDNLWQLQERQLLISATDIMGDEDEVDLIGGNILFDLSLLNNGAELWVTANAVDLGNISSNDNVSRFANVLTPIAASGSSNVALDLLSELESGDVASFERILGSLSPSVSGAIVYGGTQANGATWRLIKNRFVSVDGVHGHDKKTQGVWLHVFDETTDQQTIDDVFGFDGDTDGVALGYDKDLDALRIGFAFSHGDSKMDNDRFGADRIKVSSDQLTIYGGYQVGPGFLNARVAYSAQDYGLTRYNSPVPGEQQIVGNTGGDLYDVSIGGGYPYQVGRVLLTPVAQLHYQAMSVDSFTEDGGLNLQVNYGDVATLSSELGFMASAEYQYNGWKLSPSAHLLWNHEYLGEREFVKARLASGEVFTQQGFERDNDLIDVGVGLDLRNGSGFSFGLDVQSQIGSSLDTLSGSVNLRYNF